MTHSGARRRQSVVTTLAAAILAIGAGQACVVPGEDGAVPGEPVGEFAVTATIDSNTCGTGAFGSPDVWDFDIRLNRDGGTLYWLNADGFVSGEIASDDASFSFEAGTSTVLWEPAGPGQDDAIVVTEGNVEVRFDDDGTPGCILDRLDRSSGKLDGEGTDVEGLTGRLVYAYTEAPGTDCTPIVGETGGPAALPCEIRYDFEATRTSKPDEP